MKKLTEARSTEVDLTLRSNILNAATVFMWNIAPFLVSIATFTSYTVVQGNKLEPEEAFVAVSLFNLMRFPLR